MNKIACMLLVIVSWFVGLSIPAYAQSLFTFQKIVDTGTEMPGNPGVYFGGNPSFTAPSLDGPSLAFIGSSSGVHGYKAVYVVNGDTFTVIADTDTTMPGNSLNFWDFNSGYHLPLSLSGDTVAFWGGCRSTPVPQGIYTNIGGSLNIVADLNTPPPNSTDSFERKFGIPAISGGNVVFSGGNLTQESIYTMIGGTLQVVADLNTLRPGTTENFCDLAHTTPTNLVDIEGSDVVFSLQNGDTCEQAE